MTKGRFTPNDPQASVMSKTTKKKNCFGLLVSQAIKIPISIDCHWPLRLFMHRIEIEWKYTIESLDIRIYILCINQIIHSLLRSVWLGIFPSAGLTPNEQKRIEIQQRKCDRTAPINIIWYAFTISGSAERSKITVQRAKGENGK